MKLVVEKNTLALKALYHKYEIQVFNFIYRNTGSREIAREIIQETFTRVWFASHTFDETRGNFKGWLYTIALNTTRNEMSKKEYTYDFQGVDEMSNASHASIVRGNETPETVHSQNEIRRSVADALGKLQPNLREVIVLKNYRHLKFKEIAEVTGAPEGTVKARYHKAVELLRLCLNPNEVKKNV